MNIMMEVVEQKGKAATAHGKGKLHPNITNVMDDIKSYPLLMLREAPLFQQIQFEFREEDIPRVDINFRNVRIGLIFSSDKGSFAEEVLSIFEALNRLNNSKMVYSRSEMEDEDRGNETSYELDESNPWDVTKSKAGIRSSLTAATQLICGDAFLDNDEIT